MTDIIRLNEAINDYAARPVITRLGEPDLAIRPSTYLDALGESTNIDPSQILIDGIYGQTDNPAPFTGVGTGEMTVKSDVDGVYLAMPQIGINTGIVIPTRNDRGSLAIIKFRVNDISVDSRILSVGSGSGTTANFSITASVEPEEDDTYLLDNLVHTIAIYRGPTQFRVIDGVVPSINNYSATSYPDSTTGVGINTRSFADTPPNDMDLYGLEMYLDVELTEQQIVDYLKTL